MPRLPLIVPMLALALAGCGRDRTVPTAADNQAMDAVSNQLDNAAGELDQVDQQLPSTNSSGPPAEANGPSKT